MKRSSRLNYASSAALILFVFIFAALGASQLLFSKAATPLSQGDLNNDSKIDIYDLSILLNHFNAAYATADVNSDGIVNISDLSILLSHYNTQVNTTPPPSTPTQFSPGLNSGSAHQFCLTGMVKVGGVKYARMEWDIGASASSLESDIAAYAAKGISVIPVAGFGGSLPTDAEAQNLGNWAKAFGPGGTFWNTHSGGQYAVKYIEFGNETNMTWQYGDSGSSSSYKNRAKVYGTEFKKAYDAIQANNNKVGLLAQGDDGGVNNTNWVDYMFQGDPDIASHVSGWTIHPYGPFNNANTRITRMVNQLAAKGAPSTIPIDITEYGISTKNGVALSDNYGWPTNMTYQQTGDALTSMVNSFTGSSTYGSRLRLFIIFTVADNDYADPVNDTGREHYFGVVDRNFNDKGALTPAVRAIMQR